MVAFGKTTLLQILVCELARAICKCAVSALGFFSLCGGRKNKINSLKFALSFFDELSFACIQLINMCTGALIFII